MIPVAHTTLDICCSVEFVEWRNLIPGRMLMCLYNLEFDQNLGQYYVAPVVQNSLRDHILPAQLLGRILPMA